MHTDISAASVGVLLQGVVRQRCVTKGHSVCLFVCLSHWWSTSKRF